MELRIELEKVLKEMKKIEGVKGSIIAKNDGLLIAFYLPSDFNAKLLAALAAAITKSSFITTKEMGIGTFIYTIVKASNGYYVCFPIDTEMILACLLEKETNLGMTLIKMEKSIKEIVKILRSS
ncbi:MAG: roadblock/LC7 domain-containing protein [Candidatus Aenigmarchaeota archaeon]|nr:roadblock/LC7 domain-containing protein [Candidatus Aenigmarchaeota archaeon]